MGIIRKKKARGPYDKMIKYVVELFRKELAPLVAGQQEIMAQNEKVLEYVRQTWGAVEHRQAGEKQE